MENDILNNLGSHIRNLRIARGMTQQELAEKSELSLPFINLIENNKRNISLESLLKILSALNISLSDFFLPFSQANDSINVFLSLLQKSSDPEKYIEIFTDLLNISDK